MSYMNIDNLAGMFSQRSGVQQSMSSSIMSAIIGFIVQKMMGQGLGNMLSGGGSGSGSGGLGNIQSMLSGLEGGLNRDHELVRHVQQNAGIKDPETARQYTQQGVDVLNEQSKNDPQGLQSLLGGFLGGGGSTGSQRKGDSGGGLGGMVGDILGG
ncbi:MAG TPA: hypothetical protein VFS97_05195 [Nitrososphaeraceae archaeon]|nr:hypothetical protein [Nitrososphaeraceae archaeon]